MDGCFWHGYTDHGHMPKANADWWIAKIAMNKARDEAVNAQLESLGWTVLRFWEHEAPADVATTIVAHLEEQSGSRTAGRQ